jgi:hypothetical protein
MFNIADKDQSGDLSFNEFKNMLNDSKIQDLYKVIIEKERVEQEKVFGNGRTKTYLPYCMTKLLENLSYQGTRDVLDDERSPHP